MQWTLACVLLAIGWCAADLSVDVAALVALRASITPYPASWLYTNPCNITAPWGGVTCYQGSVTAIDIPGVARTGVVPALLGTMKNLTRLDLSSNGLTGCLPAFDGAPALTYLDLHNNSLSGVLPEFSNAALQVLDVSWNMLNGELPTALPTMRNLTTLDVSHNSIEGYVPLLATLKFLEYLDVSYNMLNAPPNVTGLTLTYLNATHNNYFCPIPSWAPAGLTCSVHPDCDDLVSEMATRGVGYMDLTICPRLNGTICGNFSCPGQYVNGNATMKCVAGQWQGVKPVCIPFCPLNQYNPSSCTNCPLGNHCQTCNPLTGACTSCPAGYSIVGTGCVACSSVTYKPIDGYALCQPCVLGLTCTSCDPIYGNCTACPDGATPRGNNCIKCPSTCATCNLDSLNCTTCVDGYTLKADSTCEQNLVSGTTGAAAAEPPQTLVGILLEYIPLWARIVLGVALLLIVFVIIFLVHRCLKKKRQLKVAAANANTGQFAAAKAAPVSKAPPI